MSPSYGSDTTENASYEAEYSGFCLCAYPLFFFPHLSQAPFSSI